MAEHKNVVLIRKGFAAFNAGDVATLSTIMTKDAVQHMPGNNRFSGDHKGLDSILAMYGEMGELTGGTMRADLESVYANDHRAVAIYQTHATRGSKSNAERHALIFEIVDGKAADLDEVPLDGKVDDAFWA
jgi:hypothetical protein